MGQDRHAALRVHHIIEVAPVMRGLPFSIRGDRGVGCRGRVLREVGRRLDGLSGSRDEAGAARSGASAGCGA